MINLSKKNKKQERMEKIILEIAAVLEKGKVNLYEMSDILVNLQVRFNQKVFKELEKDE